MPNVDHVGGAEHKGVKRFCPFMSQTFPMGYTLSTNPSNLANDIHNSKAKESLDYMDGNTRYETKITKCPSDLHFEYDVHIVAFQNADMFNMTHMYHSCLRENCMMWSRSMQICRMGPRSRPAPPSLLITEYLQKEDLDGNGKIYGVDFIIDPNDENTPPLIKNFTENIRPEMPAGISEVPWTDQMDSIQNTGDSAYYNADNPNYPEWHDGNGDHHKKCDTDCVNEHNHAFEGAGN